MTNKHRRFLGDVVSNNTINLEDASNEILANLKDSIDELTTDEAGLASTLLKEINTYITYDIIKNYVRNFADEYSE